jgi:hypothetical protein
MSRAPVIQDPDALWNRTHGELGSDEFLAQLLDRGGLPAWRALFEVARTDQELRGRIARCVRSAPLAHGRFWLVALAVLGEPVDLGAPLPPLEAHGT